ncbi:MAG: zinc ABC transporter substrate-binding protein [Firmicutes bacterium]|nr:zinc ABC transporter substrate-binding protein [Bacillota bacterium]
MVLGIVMAVIFGWTAAGWAAEEPVVVASTSWVALMVKAAGIDDVTILAPIELRHPPEYDYLPSDIALVTQADYLVWAGYEPFIKKLVEAANLPAERIVQTVTTNTPDNLREQTRKLAAVFGTEDRQAQWEEDFNAFTARLEQRALEQKTADVAVLVNFHQQAFVRWLGYDVIGVFTPDEMSPAKMAELAKLGPAMVIDNYHNPSGEGIAAIADVPYVQLANFPSKELDSLMALMEDNARRLGLVE